MLKKLQERDFDRYVDFAYELALDMTKSGYPTYADGIKTKDDFITRARRAFSRDTEGILLFERDGTTAGAIYLLDDESMPEIFGIDFPDNIYDSNVYRAMLTTALNGCKRSGAKHMIFFNESESQTDALACGFRCIGKYMCFRIAL